MTGPTIAITGPRRRGRIPRWLTQLAIRRAGGRPLRVRPPRPRVDWTQVKGLVLGGGSNVDPRRYAAELEVDEPLDPDRDRMELRMLAEALRRRLPVLGICRGAQLLNVHLGGSLHQDLRRHFAGHDPRRQLLARKRIEVKSGSRLRDALQRDVLEVNSLHRQGISRLGEGLRVSARDALGVIQAVEHARLSFVLGVQWHPELLPARRAHQRLFGSLVERARGHQPARGADLPGQRLPTS